MSHPEYHYRITVSTTDLAALYCIRAIAMYAQRTGNNKVPWGGQGDKVWQANGRCVTFRFTTAFYRTLFKEEMKRLIPATLWTVENESD